MKTLLIRFLNIIFIFSFLFAFTALKADAKRGVQLQIRANEDKNAPIIKELQLYDSSYALVIGINNYTQGWPKLTNAIRDAELVGDELKKRGFEVTFEKDLNSTDLERALKEFFIYKGEDRQARLFVWFAGHGHTEDGEGYLIPADDPTPDTGAKFRDKALSIRRFGEYVRLAKAKHAYAVFDSCFSGTIFTTERSLPPPAVTLATTMPVRQFLSSGDENQKVSDDGRFCKLFIRALRGEEKADANKDGYLTASELGMFLADRVTNLTSKRQTPRYGKLRDEDYDRGDFVFISASTEELVENHLEKNPEENIITREIGRDDQFIALDNNVVIDKKTGLEWYLRPGLGFFYFDALLWAKSLTLDGGGWRFPHIEELKSLYKKGAGHNNITPLLFLPLGQVWGECPKLLKHGNRCWFDFAKGEEGSAYNIRTETKTIAAALAVRPRKK